MALTDVFTQLFGVARLALIGKASFDAPVGVYQCVRVLVAGGLKSPCQSFSS